MQMILLNPNCRNAREHALIPCEPAERREWFRKIKTTHTRERCADCGLHIIWLPKELPSSLWGFPLVELDVLGPWVREVESRFN